MVYTGTEGAVRSPYLNVLGWQVLSAVRSMRGAPMRGGARAPPWDLNKTLDFQVLLCKNYVICNFAACVLTKTFLCERTEKACSMVKSLRKVDFSHPTGHYV